MPRVSRKPIKKSIDDYLNENLTYLISTLKNSKEIEEFLNDFLTREEKIMLAKRLMLHLMLENKFLSSQIQTSLGVSRETVRTHQKIWEHGGKVYKEYIQKLIKRENTIKLWKEIEKLLKPVELLLKAKGDIKARAKLASGEWYD